MDRYGVVSYADSLDTVGLLANDLAQIERVFKLLNKHDYNDPTSVNERTRATARALSKDSEWDEDLKNLRGLRIGVPQVSSTIYLLYSS